MSKFCLASDLHLEFGSLVIDNDEGADCLILAGDIVPFCELYVKSDISYNFIDEFFANVSREFPVVVWVPGNHEWYGSTIPNGFQRAKKYLEDMHFGNIKLINNEMVLVGDTPVYGATLWTNYNKENPISMMKAQDSMNDYMQIQKRINEIDIMVRPRDLVAYHKESLDYFSYMLKTYSRPSVVVTHHAPLMKCAGAGGLADAYASDLSDFILDHPNITTWCYGHVHERENFLLNNTDIITNCRGYKGYEKMADTFEPFYFEV